MDVMRTRAGQGRRAGWTRVTRGVHRREAVDDPWLAGLHAWQEVLPPEARFAHVTAARLHGLWLPRLPSLPVLVSMPASIPRPRRPGLRVIRPTFFPDATCIDGLRVEPLSSVALALARDLGHLDLVPAVDSLARDPAFRPDDLTNLSGRLRGLGRLRRVLHDADSRAESAWESVLRLFHQVAGAPVEPQYEVFDGEGTFVARGDLRLGALQVLHEYDGGVHLTPEQQRSDLARARRLVEAGWTRRGYTAYDLLREPQGLLRDIDNSLGREADLAPLRRWRELVAGSCWTSEGREVLTARLASPPLVT